MNVYRVKGLRLFAIIGIRVIGKDVRNSLGGCSRSIGAPTHPAARRARY